MPRRPQRVPPPPPPGFGDEEYYRLYGEPEEYQKYRKNLESRVSRSDKSPPEHEEYYVYRRYSSHEESYDYYYGPRQQEGAGGGRKRRIAPPPPPGFDDSPPSSSSRKRIAPPLSSDEDSDHAPVFKNIKVTIKNDSDDSDDDDDDDDGTPSLSDSDSDRDRKKGRKKRKKKKEREKDKRKRLEKKLAKREQELKMLSEKQRHLVTNKLTKSDSGPRKSIKDRLGVRSAAVKKEPSPQRRKIPSPVRVNSTERKRRDELLRRAEIRRQNQERSPIPYLGKKRKSRSRSPKRRGRSRSITRSRSRDRSRRKSGDSPVGRSGGSRNPPDKRRRRRRRRRRGPRGRGLKQMDLKDENAEMRAKLADRMAKSKAGKNVEDRLAKMAGIKNDRKSDGSDVYDSESGDDDDSDRIRGKMRSDKVKNETSKGSGGGGGAKSSDKWKHDKYNADEDNDRAKFGKHWSRIRREKSKDRSRNRSGSRSSSRSRSRRSRRRSSTRRSRDRSRNESRSESRSRSRERRKKRRRRGKFSRSRSRSSSTSESSRSRSRYHNSRSRSVSRGKSRSVSKEPAKKDVKQNEDLKDSENNEKEGVNMELSGALAADTNTVNGTLVKYAEPPEARKPKKKWRLYVFKGSEELPILYIHRQSAYLLGRDRKVADIPLDHPSCSKQHAVLQYRLVPYTRPDQTQGKRVQLYVMDLNSANGTFVNNSKIESQKYVQLLEKDVLKFGFSSREYVLLHDQSKEDEEDLGVD